MNHGLLRKSEDVTNTLIETAILINDSHYSTLHEGIRQLHFSEIYNLEEIIDLYNEKLRSTKREEIEHVTCKLKDIAFDIPSIINKKLDELEAKPLEKVNYHGPVYKELLGNTIPSIQGYEIMRDPTAAKLPFNPINLREYLVNDNKVDLDNLFESYYKKLMNSAQTEVVMSDDDYKDYIKVVRRNLETFSKDCKYVIKELGALKMKNINYVKSPKDKFDYSALVNELLTTTLVCFAIRINYMWTQTKHIEFLSEVN